MRPAVLGLDAQALRLGWGLALLDDGTPIACGCLPLGFLGRYSPTVRGALMQIDVLAATHGCTVAIVYLEAPFVGVGRQTVLKHAMAVGEVRQAVNAHWPEVAIELVQSATWKKRIGLSGNASKRMVAAHVRSLGWRPIVDPDDKRVAEQDALDGAAIALAGARINAEILAAS